MKGTVQDTTERRKDGVRLEKELMAIAAVVDDMLLGELDDAETERRVLDACLAATDSVYGMIGKINEHGKFDTTTHSSQALEDCAFPEALAREVSTGMTVRGVLGWPMMHGQPLICNHIEAHPDSIGLPKGHVPLECFLGVPLKEDGNVVGMVAVANKPGGYTEGDRDTLSRLASTISVSRQHRLALIGAQRTSFELERLVAERTKALQESEASLAEAQRVAHVGNWDWRIPTNELVWSDEIYRIFGLKPKEFGATYEAFLNSVHPDDRESVKESINEALYERKPYSIDHRVVLPDGDIRFVHEQGEVTFDENDEPARMMGTVQDITERKIAEQELIRSEKLAGIGTLAAGMAHEFNNPLSAMMAYAEAILDETDLSQMKEHAARIVNAAGKAAEVVRWLSRYSRVGLDLSQTDVDLNEVLRDSVETLKFTRGSASIKPELDLGDIPPISGNRTELEQVFVNLLNNGVDAMPDGGKICLRTRLAGEHVEVEVSDTGMGIPVENLSKIFEPFFTTKDMGEGTGLGLYVLSMIVEKHQGRIQVRSSEGEGTTFTLMFPTSDQVSVSAREGKRTEA